MTDYIRDILLFVHEVPLDIRNSSFAAFVPKIFFSIL